MNKSNYSIYYLSRDDIREGSSVKIEVSDEFVEFAKKQDINQEKYEELGLRMIRNSGWPDFTKADIFNAPTICGWWEENGKETGLLHFINVPGNAAGVSLEQGINGWVYYPNNMDNMSQASVVLGIITYYLKDIESNLESL